jgi:hypothetical protein
MLVIPALRRLRQEEGEPKASLAYLVRLHLKKRRGTLGTSGSRL